MLHLTKEEVGFAWGRSLREHEEDWGEHEGQGELGGWEQGGPLGELGEWGKWEGCGGLGGWRTLEGNWSEGRWEKEGWVGDWGGWEARGCVEWAPRQLEEGGYERGALLGEQA